uniref:protein-glucosylgalactosylhydroxylysine glucosidase-like isoform X4 n=1 Tax=Ciona intestinalis TaxID=7719 RepID=UPI00089DD491|nr:protein-glucosylgalactosylhydroxylysine glucosidase-like isoform X4 [Ciona intestinalis]|eukprot:XP_018670417.1 protein-glucosylgalactosylhydroxylysine glucosidase-like isoform X4 [Ciona intestinalis]
MVGLSVTSKEGGNRPSVKASSRNFSRPKSPMNLTAVLGFLLLFCLFMVSRRYDDVLSCMRSGHRFVKTNREFRKTDPYVLESSILPNDSRFYPTVANGVVGTVIFSDTIYMAGLYNGYKGESHRARLQNNIPYVYVPDSTLWSTQLFTQDTKNGMFTICLSDTNVIVTQEIYAHKLLTNLLVTEVSVTCKIQGTCYVRLHDLSGPVSKDMSLNSTETLFYNSSYCNCSKDIPSSDCTKCQYLGSAIHKEFTTVTPEMNGSSHLTVHVIYSQFPKKLTVQNIGNNFTTKKFVFMFAVGETRASTIGNYIVGMGTVTANRLFQLHLNEWLRQWNSALIDVKNDIQSTQYMVSALYYILSNFPSTKNPQAKFYGVSPGGLPNGGSGVDYMGHVFWDQDFWMAPALLPFYPELVRKILTYRVRHLVGALAKAKSFGYEGADYPWETAYTGSDVCPGENYVEYEIHVTADIIHLLKQYIYATNDWSFLVECQDATEVTSRTVLELSSEINTTCIRAYDMLRQTAEFWSSRVTWNAIKGRYVLNNVMGPDEWHAPVNNSAFTNVAVAQNLNFAAEVATKLDCDEEKARRWQLIAKLLYIPYNETAHYHPEYDGFYSNETVKQADTAMLGFPLGLPMLESVQYNDLKVYNDCTSAFGPAMTWGMFAINWLQLNDTENAKLMYRRQLRNIHIPFNIWSENADSSGAVNFLTGMGGYLQSVLYGYFGLRYRNGSVTLNPTLIPHSYYNREMDISIHSFKYRHFTFDIFVNQTSINLILKSTVGSSCAYVNTSSHTYVMCRPQELIIQRQRIHIKVEK